MMDYMGLQGVLLSAVFALALIMLLIPFILHSTFFLHYRLALDRNDSWGSLFYYSTRYIFNREIPAHDVRALSSFFAIARLSRCLHRFVSRHIFPLILKHAANHTQDDRRPSAIPICRVHKSMSHSICRYHQTDIHTHILLTSFQNPLSPSAPLAQGPMPPSSRIVYYPTATISPFRPPQLTNQHGHRRNQFFPQPYPLFPRGESRGEDEPWYAARRQ
ncbi:hypothetical protein BJ875DRAFT_19596 [Amylocarpus encephaloides]|uniref:Uncharacterized protein n=1 Tax=Amylocarpus encephaloides TaxID=45428 RepID=A0A9P8C535_9HELO|nr:hypothetical protein BJ875DRAFT_19596 [Amylocarpus encephaloides]